MDSDMSDENDTTDDIWPFKRKSKKKPPKTDSSNAISTLYGNVDCDEYFMFPSMGKCLIFNHKVFTKLPERKGTDKDVQRLYCQFKKLGFKEVKVFNDLEVREVMQKLEEAGQEDHSNNSCFICCILTHGDKGILHARDGVYSVDSLYDYFKGSVCPTLVAKPKIFLIQACQGYKADPGMDVVCKESMDSDLKLKFPTYADFLIALSTFPGFVSFKNESFGSYFIQFLCDVLEEHAQNKHLMDMLTITNRRVAFNFESSNYKDASKSKKKQVPFIMSTLTRNLKFNPKTS